MSLENGSNTEFDVDPAVYEISLRSLNDRAHLEPFPVLLCASWGVREN